MGVVREWYYQGNLEGKGGFRPMRHPGVSRMRYRALKQYLLSTHLRNG